MPNPSASGLLVIERLLRDRDGIWRDVVGERGLRELILQMLASSAISLALYGAVLGASFGWQQALSSFVKLPLLFLATLCICLPTLYLFNLVFGARLSVIQAVALIMVSVTVTAVLTLAFAPISLFFLITAHSYQFFKLLNVAILALTAIVGLRFLTQGMQALNDQQGDGARQPAEPVVDSSPVEAAAVAEAGSGAVPADAPVALVAAPGPNGGPVSAVLPVPRPAPAAAPVSPVPVPAGYPAPPGYRPLPPGPAPLRVPRRLPDEPRQASMSLLYIWILLFGFVGTQLGWTLRPFFGSPGEPFGLFRHLDGTFYGDIVHSIGQLFGG